MLIYYALGRHGVEQTREASRSALPGAPVIPDRCPDPPVFRLRASVALHRLADWIGPVDARARRSPLRQA
jgi:hypothetical protein